MNGATKRGRLIRFSVFEVDLDSGELFKQGRKVKLQDQPFELLFALLDRPGEVVTREQLKQRVWPSDTLVDFEHGLNRAVNKVRDALGDSAESPRFIETLHRRGYRFIGSIQENSSAEPPPTPGLQRDETCATRPEEGFWVAVLPFKCGTNSDHTALAEGITNDIVTGLARFSYLRVISRSSTARYACETAGVRSAGKELGARYLIEGNIRQAGTTLRIAAQLIDTSSGVELWAEAYDRPFPPEAGFELQDDIVPRIVSTIADTQGVLPHSMSEALRNRDPGELSPYEAVLRSFAHFRRLNAGEHAAARAALERAVQQAPGQADCWAMLSMLYREEYAHEFNVRPDPLGRALAAARHAVEAAPSNHLAYHALASTLFFRHEFRAFRHAAERAIELNPMDGFAAGYLGFMIAYAGDWERGCALAQHSMSRLNPHYPGWYWFPCFFDAYRKGDYRGALEIAQKINMPGFWRTQVALAAVYGQLGDKEAARNAVRELLAIKPNFAVAARRELRKWWDAELTEHLLDGLSKAGLEVAH